jgi:hypothetical protein
MPQTFEAAVQLISPTTDVPRVSPKNMVYLQFDNSKDFDYLVHKSYTAKASISTPSTHALVQGCHSLYG